MNYKKYKRKPKHGFFKKLWYWFYVAFGFKRRAYLKEMRRRLIAAAPVLHTIATQKGYRKGCFDNPRFKGYKE